MVDTNYVTLCWGVWDLVVEINSVMHRGKGVGQTKTVGTGAKMNLQNGLWVFFCQKSGTNKAMGSYI